MFKYKTRWRGCDHVIIQETKIMRGNSWKNWAYGEEIAQNREIRIGGDNEDSPLLSYVDLPVPPPPGLGGGKHTEIYTN